LLTRALDFAFKHSGEFRDCVRSAQVFLIAMPPTVQFPDHRLGERRIGLEVELNDAGTKIRPADIRGEDRVVSLEYPRRRQMNGADQAGLVRIVANERQIDGLLGFE
jgi:hypothetical protein